MSELTLQLVEQVVASRAPASAVHPIQSELLPRLSRARSLEEAEAAIHDAMRSLAWLADAFVKDAGEQPAREARERVVPRLLASQEDLEARVARAEDPMTTRKVIVAHETLRRFLASGLPDARRAPASAAELAPAATPSIELVRDMALRLALLVVAIEHLVSQGSSLVASLADKAFATSQTLRRAMRDLEIDLTPWIDAPAATRARRILEAASGFWSSLGQEQRRAVDEAWEERVEVAPRWPLPPS